jgi:hypothetical protein
MLRAHAPLIAVSTVIAIVLYLIFRDLKSLRATLTTVEAAVAAANAAVRQMQARPTERPDRANVPPASFKEVGEEAGDIMLPSENQPPSPGPTRATKRPGATKRVTYDA